MKQLLIILFLFPTLLCSQSEGGFGFRRFANTANLTATSVNNSDKNASRRAYVHSTGLYYRWNGSAWSIEETIDTFSVSGNVLSLSILNDGIPAKTVNLSSYLQTLSIDSGSITGKERFGITISGGNTVHFDVAKSIYTDNGATISGGTNVTVNSNTLNLTTNGFTQPVVRKKSNQSIGYFDRYVINNDSLDIYYISPLFGISAFGSDLGLSSTEKLQLTGDSVLISTIATTTALKFLTGTTSGNYLKRMVGTTDGDVVAWDGVSSHWEVRPKTDYNINIGNSDLTTDDNERTLTLLDDFNIIGDGSTPDFYVEMGSVAGGRLNIRDSSLIYNVDVGGTNKLTAGGSGVHISTGTSDQVTINTDKINLKDASGTVLDLELLDDTRMKVDSTNEFAIGRWPDFPGGFEYIGYNRYGLEIADNTSDGKRTTIAGMAYSRTSSSYITADRGSYQFNVKSLLSSGTAQMNTGATPTTFYNYMTHPLDIYDNVEYGFRNNWAGIPKDKTGYGYMFQGGDVTQSAPYDTASLSMWIGIPQITDTTSSAKSTLGTKAVSKVRGWGVQSLFHRDASQYAEHPFNWIKISTGSVAADTLLDGINFYGRYAFENSAPSVTSGDTSLMAWVGTGSATNPIWIDKDQFGGGGTNIYNSNGTTTTNTRVATVLESIRFVGTADVTQQYPFQVHSTGNEPPIQLWKGNTDSVYLNQSDVEYHFGSSTVFQIESSAHLLFQADSIIANTLATKTKIQNIVGISNSGTLQQIEGSSGGQVLTWNASGYWELGTGGGAIADGDYGDITVSSSGTVWTIDAGVVTNTKLASGSGGFYKGSGTIASGATATMTASSTFRINYSGGNTAFITDDVNNAASLFGQDGTYTVSADNTSAYMTGALSSTFSLGSTGGTTLTASVANTNTVNNRETIVTNSSGTAATGLGTGTLYQLESSTTNSQDVAEMDVVWSDATHASRTGDFVFKTVASASALTEAFRIGGTNYQLTATASVSNTNTAADRLVIKTNSSGTAAAAFGGRILFQGESSTTDNRDMIALSANWITATDATRDAQLSILTSNAGGALTERYVFRGNGTFAVGSSSAVQLSNSALTTATSFTIGNSSSALILGGNSGTVTIGASSGQVVLSTSNASGIVLNPYGATVTGSKINLGNASNHANTSGTKNLVDITAGFNPASGTGIFAALSVSGIINQTGTASGNVKGIVIEPTLTGILGTYYALEIVANSTSAKGVYQSGSSTTNNFVGATGFGATTVPTDKVEITGNLALLTAGNKIKIATGSNASAGQSGAMTAGSITINTTAVTSNSLIFLTHASVGGTQGTLSVGTITAGTSFVINSSSALDTSTVNYWIIN